MIMHCNNCGSLAVKKYCSHCGAVVPENRGNSLFHLEIPWSQSKDYDHILTFIQTIEGVTKINIDDIFFHRMPITLEILGNKNNLKILQPVLKWPDVGFSTSLGAHISTDHHCYPLLHKLMEGTLVIDHLCHCWQYFKGYSLDNSKHRSLLITTFHKHLDKKSPVYCPFFQFANRHDSEISNAHIRMMYPNHMWLGFDASKNNELVSTAISEQAVLANTAQPYPERYQKYIFLDNNTYLGCMDVQIDFVDQQQCYTIDTNNFYEIIDVKVYKDRMLILLGLNYHHDWELSCYKLPSRNIKKKRMDEISPLYSRVFSKNTIHVKMSFDGKTITTYNKDKHAYHFEFNNKAKKFIENSWEYNHHYTNENTRELLSSTQGMITFDPQLAIHNLKIQSDETGLQQVLLPGLVHSWMQVQPHEVQLVGNDYAISINLEQHCITKSVTLHKPKNSNRGVLSGKEKMWRQTPGTLPQGLLGKNISPEYCQMLFSFSDDPKVWEKILQEICIERNLKSLLTLLTHTIQYTSKHVSQYYVYLCFRELFLRRWFQAIKSVASYLADRKDMPALFIHYCSTMATALLTSNSRMFLDFLEEQSIVQNNSKHFLDLYVNAFITFANRDYDTSLKNIQNLLRNENITKPLVISEIKLLEDILLVLEKGQSIDFRGNNDILGHMRLLLCYFGWSIKTTKEELQYLQQLGPIFKKISTLAK